jgi:hypothetical protein
LAPDMSWRPFTLLLTLLLATVWGAPQAPGANLAPAPANDAQIDDPMLAPPAPAARQIATWEEALRMLRERSPTRASPRPQ